MQSNAAAGMHTLNMDLVRMVFAEGQDFEGALALQCYTAE